VTGAAVDDLVDDLRVLAQVRPASEVRKASPARPKAIREAMKV
jgi:hypothetical protein